MRLLLDQGLPRSLGGLLASGGHEAVHVADVGMHAASDADILALAVSENRTVGTLDADFHALLALFGASQPSVVRIRIESLQAPQLAALLRHVIARCSQDLEGGALVTVQPGRVRVRRLPLLR